MNEQIKVVGVCTANVGRSPILESVLRHELEERGVGHITVSSAGTNVENILKNTVSVARELRIFDAGMHYGLVRTEIKQKVTDLLAKGPEQENTDEIRALYAEVRPLVHGHLVAMRNQALREAGLTHFPAPYTPFQPAPDSALVLPVNNRECEKVEEAYRRNDIPFPTIKTYGTLVGTQDLEDNLKGGLEEARRVVAYFMDTRRKAIDDIVSAYGKR